MRPGGTPDRIAIGWIVRQNCRMPSTHLAFHVHVVFSTKNREPWLAPTPRPRVHEYIGGVLTAENVFPHMIGGMGDHLHALIGLRATHCLADVVQRMKSVSSRWIHEELRLAGFAWQEGYGAFSVSPSHLERVARYIQNQDKHHRVKSFQEEYVEMLQAGMVAYDERHLW